MNVNFADFNPVIPIIILWAAAVIFGKKKRQAQRPGATESQRSLSPDPDAGAIRGAAATDLARALEALKAAEESARHPRPASTLHEAPTRQGTAPGLMPDQTERARAYLETRKAQARSHLARQPQREVFQPKSSKARTRLSLEDHSELSQDALEGDTTDFDDDAVRIADARLKEAEDFERVLAPGESRRMAARITAAPAPAPAVARPTPAPAASVLSRFATGRLRDAVILSEILGRPMGERPGPR